jgi:hypothetical protein
MPSRVYLILSSATGTPVPSRSFDVRPGHILRAWDRLRCFGTKTVRRDLAASVSVRRMDLVYRPDL